MSMLTKIWRIATREGFGVAARKARRRLEIYREAANYRKWVRQYDTLSESDRSEILKKIEALAHKPLISVLMPVYNVDEVWLRKAVESVRQQLYPYWELCIADDKSTKPHVRRVLEQYAARDPRIKIFFREVNGHISAASNSALELVTGEFTALLDHDDELSQKALYHIAGAINSHPSGDIFYTDEDQIDERGQRYDPKFKPNWSPDTFYSVNFTNHLTVYRTSLIRSLNGWRLGTEGSQDYDLMLRAVEVTRPEKILHIPHVLYHWRAVPGSVALSSGEKTYAHLRARTCLDEHFARSGIQATTIKGVSELHRTVYALKSEPLVSIVLPGGDDLEKTVHGIIEATEYPAYEIVAACESSAAEIAHDSRVRLIESRGSSRYHLLNAAANFANGQVVCFIDGSTMIKRADWLRELAAQAIQECVGAVGGKVLFPDRRIKHAGLLLGIDNGVGRAHYRFPDYHYGYNMRLSITQNLSAVSADCLAVRKEVFDNAGGFDAEHFPEFGGDIDLCLRLLESGFRNVWTPWAEVVQTSPPRESADAELERLRTKWPAYFENDPYYNPNLSNEDGYFRLSFPPRKRLF